MNRKSWYFLAPVLAGILIFFDQFTKYLARRDLTEAGYNIIDGVFKLSLVKNKGAAWGIFQGRVGILSIVSIALIIILVIVFFKVPDAKRFFMMRLLIVAVFSGAVGNQIDRFAFGYVTDFLYFELIDFPVFNVADCYITISMVLFVFLMLFYYKDEDIEFLSFKKNKETAKKKDSLEVKPGENADTSLETSEDAEETLKSAGETLKSTKETSESIGETSEDA